MLARKIWFNGAVAQDVQEELEREPADVLVSDAMLAGALCAGQAAALPTVALFHTAYCLFGSGPMVELMSPAIPALNAIRAQLGLAAARGMADVHDACSLALVASVSEFEPPIPVPPNVRFVGPMLEGAPLVTAHDDVDVADGPEALVVVSLSTSFQGQRPLLQKLVDALSGLRVPVLVTTGPAVAPASVRPAPNSRIVSFVPHDHLLPKASLLVTHAGLGTVMNALRHGVPMLCLPMGRDQFFNAGRVEALDAGRTIDADADPDTIAVLAQQMLQDPVVRDGAKSMANTLARYGGARDALAELELLVRH